MKRKKILCTASWERDISMKGKYIILQYRLDFPLFFIFNEKKSSLNSYKKEAACRGSLFLLYVCVCLSSNQYFIAASSLYLCLSENNFCLLFFLLPNYIVWCDGWLEINVEISFPEGVSINFYDFESNFLLWNLRP